MAQGVKERLISFLKYKELSQSKFEKICGFSNGYINNIRSGIGADKLQSVLCNFPELNATWLISGEGEMLKSLSIGDNNLIGNEISHSSIDNRHYYSDSPDVLKAQVDLLEERIKEKDAQIKEKDAQIKEKDAQIKEKDAQISRLLTILEKK